MKKIHSKDGTVIAYEVLGSGPALIVIGGALADHTFYNPLANELAKKYTVYSFDRRGRGHSPDTLPYAVEREVEDVLSLISVAGEPVIIYGHSAGAALALRVAAETQSVSSLVLVDPPFSAHGPEDKATVAQFMVEKDTVQSFHDKGDHKAAAAFFLSGFGMSPESVADLLNSSAGTTMIRSAYALPYDYAVLGVGLVPVELARKVMVKTFIFSSPEMNKAAFELAAAIPKSHFKVLPKPMYELSAIEVDEALSSFVF